MNIEYNILIPVDFSQLSLKKYYKNLKSPFVDSPGVV